MIHAYELSAGRLTAVGADAAGVLWWDLVHPSREEEKALAAALCSPPSKREEQHSPNQCPLAPSYFGPASHGPLSIRRSDENSVKHQ